MLYNTEAELHLNYGVILMWYVGYKRAQALMLNGRMRYIIIFCFISMYLTLKHLYNVLLFVHLLINNRTYTY